MLWSLQTGLFITANLSEMQAIQSPVLVCHSYLFIVQHAEYALTLVCVVRTGPNKSECQHVWRGEVWPQESRGSVRGPLCVLKVYIGAFYRVPKSEEICLSF